MSLELDGLLKNKTNEVGEAMVVVGILLAIIAVMLIGGSFYFYQTAVARGKKVFIEEDPDLQMDPELNTRPARDKAWWKEQTFERWSIHSRDNLKLVGHYLPAKTPTNKVVILAHGYSGDASIMSEFAYVYHENYNLNILLPDARGHGESEGHYIGFGWHERMDYLDWITKVREVLGDHIDIILHGVSMGAATVMMASGEKLPSQVKAIVADCGYTSAQDELTYQLKRMYHLPAFPILALTSGLTKLRAGYTFKEASALTQVKKSKVPILFIHGEEDKFVPTEMVHRLYQACSSEKELLVIPEAGHGLAHQVAPDTYLSKVEHFIFSYMDNDKI